MKTNTEDNGRKRIEYQNIVVPIDYSDTSLKAVDYARTIAREFGARIHLLHVLEFPAVFMSNKPAYAQWDRIAMENATKRLTEFVKEKMDDGIIAESDVRLGRAYHEICKMAQERNGDLIVIGTHGLTGIKHLVLGSTAEQVVRHAPCSVLTVRPEVAIDPGAIFHPRKIMVPTDFSVPAGHSYQAAIEVAQQFGSELHLVYVVPVYYPPGEYNGIDYRSLEADETRNAEKELQNLAEKAKQQDLRVETSILRGRVASELTNAAGQGIDLLVLSTHGRTGWQHAILGSTTEEVVRHSRCPVLVVRRQKSEKTSAQSR